MLETEKQQEQPLRVLFLCTHNSSRSQMAEGLLHAYGGVSYSVFSAGTEPRVVHPLAIKAMQEIGIDISDHRAKSLDEFREQPPMDLVVTVCDEAAEACPFFPNAHRQVHWGFSDPSKVEGSEEVRLAAFRHIRDQIAARIKQFLRDQPTTSFEHLYAAANKSKIENAKSSDLATVLTLLSSAGLPQDGLAEIISTTVVIRNTTKIIGCAALEMYGTVALLRSVAVDSAYRSRGLGHLLIQDRLQAARQCGIQEVYLLTETASDYFSRFGFRQIERSAVSPDLHSSVEWHSVCPASAQVMVLQMEVM